MTTEHSTIEVPKALHPSQTIEASRRASALMEHPPKASRRRKTSVYVDTGAGLAFSIDSDGTFHMYPLKRDGRAALELTPEETRAMYHFWHAVCAPAIVNALPAAVAHVIANRTKEQTNGID